MADRLKQSGVQLTLTEEDFGSFIDPVDPDGQSVQVHETPPR